MSWQAKTTTTPPAKKTSKMLYSPDLVDSVNGTYGYTSLNNPEEVRYTTNSGGQLLYYDGLYEVPDGQGYFQAFLSAGNTNTGTYWEATFRLLTKIGRTEVLSGTIFGSQDYVYTPSYVEPYQEVSKIIPVAAGPYLVDEGDYYAVFSSGTIYSATGSTPPITFGSTSMPTPPVAEYEVSITIGGSSSITFILP